MTIWKYMAGGDGRHEDYVIANERIHMNYNLDCDAMVFDSQQTIRDHLVEHKSPDETISRHVAAQDAANLWRFSRDAQLDDVVVIRLQPTISRTVAIGQVSGEYVFDPDMSAGENQPGPHYREVNWLAVGIPLDEFEFEDNWLHRPQTFSPILEGEEEAARIILNTVNRWRRQR